jgi:transcription initiation factor IIE alpha subunit
MNSLKPNLYFFIYDWMIHRLNLNGTQLTTFAYIYSISKLKGKVTEDDLCRNFNLKPRTSRDRLKLLFDRGLLQRQQKSGLKALYWAELDEIHKKAFILEL